MFQCENDLYESKCIKITTTTTTTTTECFLKARQKNSDALKNIKNRENRTYITYSGFQYIFLCY